jgi:hypothetical protein
MPQSGLVRNHPTAQPGRFYCEVRFSTVWVHSGRRQGTNKFLKSSSLLGRREAHNLHRLNHDSRIHAPFRRRQHSLVTMVTRLRAGRSVVYSSAGARDFSLLRHVQTVSGPTQPPIQWPTHILQGGYAAGV